jgi:formate dehydrogenase major subunit
VQGATDVGPNPDSLPGYYGIATGSWRHWARVWNIDYDWMKGRFASQAMMEKPGMTVSRWIDGVLEKNELIDQDPNLRMMFFWGHAPNSQTRGLEMKKAMDKLDLLVVIDPYPSATAGMAAMPSAAGDLNPSRAVYLLPAATQYECAGSCTASNRSIQWREKVVDPLFESKPDHTIMYMFAEKLGFADQFVGKKDGKQNIQVVNGEPVVEDVLRNEINKGTWTIGYTGQSPERLKLHMKNMHTFDVKTLRAKGGPCDGDYFGLPWHRRAEAPRQPEPVRHLAARHAGRRELPRELRRGARRPEPARGRRLGV